MLSQLGRFQLLASGPSLFLHTSSPGDSRLKGRQSQRVGGETQDLRQGAPCCPQKQLCRVLVAREATPLCTEGSKGRAHLGLGRKDMNVDKGTFSSRHMGVFVSGLQTVSQAQLAIVTSIEHDWLLQGVPWAPGSGMRSLNNTRRRVWA